MEDESPGKITNPDIDKNIQRKIKNQKAHKQKSRVIHCHVMEKVKSRNRKDCLLPLF